MERDDFRAHCGNIKRRLEKEEKALVSASSKKRPRPAAPPSDARPPADTLPAAPPSETRPPAEAAGARTSLVAVQDDTAEDENGGFEVGNVLEITGTTGPGGCLVELVMWTALTQRWGAKFRADPDRLGKEVFVMLSPEDLKVPGAPVERIPSAERTTSASQAVRQSSSQSSGSRQQIPSSSQREPAEMATNPPREAAPAHLHQFLRSSSCTIVELEEGEVEETPQAVEEPVSPRPPAHAHTALQGGGYLCHAVAPPLVGAGSSPAPAKGVMAKASAEWADHHVAKGRAAKASAAAKALQLLPQRPWRGPPPPEDALLEESKPKAQKTQRNDDPWETNRVERASGTELARPPGMPPMFRPPAAGRTPSGSGTTIV